MGDPEQARQAKALEGIHHALKDLNKTMLAINDNAVFAGRMFKEWLESSDKLDIDEARNREIIEEFIKSAAGQKLTEEYVIKQARGILPETDKEV